MICPSCGSENIEGSDRCENCLGSFRDLDVPRADAAEGLARHVMEDKLSELEKETAVIVSPDTPAIEVARQMKDMNTGCALVLDGTKLVGIFTEHDVLLKMCSHLMSDKNDSSDQIDEDYEPTVSRGEGLQLGDALFSDIPLEEIRIDEFVVEETFVEAEVSRFVANEDADKQVNQGLRAILQVPVKKLMTTNPETLHEHESVAFALNKMSLGRFRHIPVEKNDGTYTVASIKSVLKYIAREDW